MDTALINQLKILKLNESKPNFSELSRTYDVDRRTVKKYYDGYEGKPAHHNKSSKLDMYEPLIREKLSIKGTTVKAVYEFMISEIDSDIGTYSNFNKYQAENAIRPFTVGRKNWLFADTPKGADASATVYSLVETAKANGLNVYTYLQYLLIYMPDADWRNHSEELDMLMPWSEAVQAECKQQ